MRAFINYKFSDIVHSKLYLITMSKYLIQANYTAKTLSEFWFYTITLVASY